MIADDTITTTTGVIAIVVVSLARLPLTLLWPVETFRPSTCMW